MVIGYLGNKIKDYFGDSWNGKKIHYVEQAELLGTGHAVWQSKEVIGKNKFLVLMGDDLYSKKDLEKLIKHDRAMLIQNTDIPSTGGLMKIENGMIKGITECGEPKHGFIYTGACFLDHTIFEANLEKVTPNSKEYGLPQTIVAQNPTRAIVPVYADFWLRITSPEDIEEAGNILCAH